MEGFMKYCGFLFSHSIWSIADGDILVPFIGTKNNEERPEIIRFSEANSYQDAVEKAEEYISKENKKYKYTAICFEGLYTDSKNNEKKEAIYLKAFKNSQEKTSELTIILPYTKDLNGKILKSENFILLENKGITEDEFADNFDFFWEGIEEHSQGWDVLSKTMKEV